MTKTEFIQCFIKGLKVTLEKELPDNYTDEQRYLTASKYIIDARLQHINQAIFEAWMVEQKKKEERDV